MEKIEKLDLFDGANGYRTIPQIFFQPGFSVTILIQSFAKIDSRSVGTFPFRVKQG